MQKISGQLKTVQKTIFQTVFCKKHTPYLFSPSKTNNYISALIRTFRAICKTNGKRAKRTTASNFFEKYFSYKNFLFGLFGDIVLHLAKKRQ